MWSNKMIEKKAFEAGYHSQCVIFKCFLFFPHLGFCFSGWYSPPPFPGLAVVRSTRARLMVSHSHLIFCSISRPLGPCPYARYCFPRARDSFWSIKMLFGRFIHSFVFTLSFISVFSLFFMSLFVFPDLSTSFCISASLSANLGGGSKLNLQQD